MVLTEITSLETEKGYAFNGIEFHFYDFVNFYYGKEYFTFAVNASVFREMDERTPLIVNKTCSMKHLDIFQKKIKDIKII